MLDIHWTTQRLSILLAMAFIKKHISVFAFFLAIGGTTANVSFDSRTILYKSENPLVRNLRTVNQPHRTLIMFSFKKLPWSRPHPEPQVKAAPVPHVEPEVPGVHVTPTEQKSSTGLKDAELPDKTTSKSSIDPSSMMMTGMMASETMGTAARASGAGTASHTAAAEAAEGPLHRGATKHKSVPYTVFVQKWMPALQLGSPPNWVKTIAAREAIDWNKNLKIDSLRSLQPQKLHRAEKLPREARKAIDKYNWIAARGDMGVYHQGWNVNGRSSGLSPENYIKEINRLQKLHPTPKLLHVKKDQDTVLHSRLVEVFHNACLVCFTQDQKQYFVGVRYCHSLNEQTHHANGIVPFSKHCGVCPSNTACTQTKIHIRLVPVV